MNSQKTGQLIAQQRGALGLTQKQLASQLHISRPHRVPLGAGRGFPRPVPAGAAGGCLGAVRDRTAPGRTPAAGAAAHPQTEHTARDVLNSAGEMVRKTARRFRWLLTALAALVVLAGAVCLWLAARAIPAYVPETIAAAQAVATCPDCLITTGEYELIRELLEQEEITAHFADGATFSFDMSFSSQYQDRVQVNGQHPGYFTISILGWNLYVDYGTCMDGRVLQVYTPDGTVIEHVYAYPSPPETVAGTGPDGETVTLTRPGTSAISSPTPITPSSPRPCPGGWIPSPFQAADDKRPRRQLVSGALPICSVFPRPVPGCSPR